MTGSWQGVFSCLWFLVVLPEKVSICHQRPVLFSLCARRLPLLGRHAGFRANEYLLRLLRNHIISIPFPLSPALWVDCMLLDSPLSFEFMLAVLRLRSCFLFMGPALRAT